ncbi:hypothetical protein E3N88_43918 [Mikania micrantha]|uniref:Integrase catalytic domain-containing protein n=1 Tax=Mikania micrantha TaxID=192012 RepID=A0A5N6LFS9_9ASTR|nr:hypothetical protein E3N88_43918 [Mikania micrantha]
MAANQGANTGGNRNDALVVPIRDGGSITYQCPLLSATNYTSWAIKMESFMDAQGIWDAIEPPTDVEVDLKIRKKARAFIFQALPEEILLQVAGHKEAKDVWDALKVRYLGADRVQQARIQNLNREFELLAMRDGDTIDDFAGKIGEVTSKFRTLGITMEEKTKVKKLLGAAPDRFLPIVVAIEQFLDLNVMMFEELVGRLKAYEERVKPTAPSTNCWAPKKQNEEANLTKEDEEPTLLMVKTTQEQVMLNEENVFPSTYANDGGECETWYLDNGASNHMIGEKSYFSELNEKLVGNVKFGDGSDVEIKGKGSIMFQCKNGEQRLITNVYYIPELCNNILSLGQFDGTGCKIHMQDGFLWLYDQQGDALMKVKKSQNHLYRIKLQVIPLVCLLSKIDETAWLWHARLGHLNFEAIRKMSKEGLAKGIPKVEHKSQVCEACLVGKQKQLPFPPHAKFQANQPLELIHADLCGPISPSTLVGNKYFLLLVDDYSRYMWIHKLKSKDQAPDAFKTFKQAAELESGFKVKALRTDRGGEFTSTKFEQVCNEDGIRRFLTAPYTPQQNGVVERRNQTILGTTRSILKAMKLPQWMWGEGARHAIYILNRTPTKAVEKGTPYKAYKGWNLTWNTSKCSGALPM